MFKFWLALRSIKSRKNFNLTAVFSIIGLSLGVASLVVSMVVLSSYFGTLKSTVIDVYGDINLVPNVTYKETSGEIIPKELSSLVSHKTPFLNASAVAVANGKMSAVFVQGFKPKNVNKVLNLGNRLILGEAPFESKVDEPSVWVGQRLAKTFKVKVGDSINLVVPINNNLDDFTPKVQSFKVKGVLSFGRYDYDSRYLITDLDTLSSFADLKSTNYGYRLKLFNSDEAPDFALKFNSSLQGGDFWAASWRSINSNLFAAVDFEKWIIFLVMMIIIVVASFNVASTLFVNVIRQFKDIAVLKSIGLSSRDIKQIFIFQGLIIGFIGYVVGLVLGFGLCNGFIYAIKHWEILNAEVYKLEGLVLSFDILDLVLIAIVCLLICFLATLIPAAKGGRLTPMKGFGYE